MRRRDPLYGYKGSSARERLLNMLSQRTIIASPMPSVPSRPRAVCFSECIWDGLISLSDSYSSYGVVFEKKFIFTKGGGPALYVRGNLVKAYGSRFLPQLAPFIAPYDPDGVLRHKESLGYPEEREWRLNTDLRFDYIDVKFVLVKTIEDAEEVSENIGKNNLPLGKMIPMDVYRNIKDAWGP